MFISAKSNGNIRTELRNQCIENQCLIMVIFISLACERFLNYLVVKLSLSKATLESLLISINMAIMNIIPFRVEKLLVSLW